jgi:hypothetical protein
MAQLDVIAGRLRQFAGEVVRDDATAVCLVRAGDCLPPGIEPRAALALWASLAADAPPAADATRASARGRSSARMVWLAGTGLDNADEAIVQRAAEDVRAGAGAMIWASGAGRERADRVLVVATSSVPSSRGEARRARRAGRRTSNRRAIGRFALAAAASRGALALAAIAGLWLAACAAAVAAHEDFWFELGSARALDQLARLAAIGVAIACATTTATRCAAARSWPAMLRETGATPPVRWTALVSADLGGAVAAGAVAALPALWTMLGTASATSAAWSMVVTFGAVGIAGVVAGAIARLGAASLGALAGAGIAIALRW